MSAIKILYAEDELSLAKIVKESLESRNFQVHMETDGAKVTALFRLAEPDICVLDIMLPNKNGFQIANEIRKLNETIPIIFLTAKTQTVDVVQGFRSGGNDYIRKPFSIEELIVRIEHLLQRSIPAEADKEIVPIGGFTFLPLRQLLMHDGGEKKLSYRETELLKILCGHHGAIVHRKDILNQLWGNDSFFNSRNLDVYITKLRNYLKKDPSLEIITIKGIGYRFVKE